MGWMFWLAALAAAALFAALKQALKDVADLKQNVDLLTAAAKLTEERARTESENAEVRLQAQRTQAEQQLQALKSLTDARIAGLKQTVTTLESAKGVVEAANARYVNEFLRVQPFLQIADAHAEAAKVRATVREEADLARKTLRDELLFRRQQAETNLQQAVEQASRVIQDAKVRAEQIAGDAYKALRHADHLKGVVVAMQNKIEGYGDRYIVPTYSLLDDLAATYGFTEAGRDLKSARSRTAMLVESGRGATCEYVEAERRETAIRFVLDAFNGKVDSILSRTKADNFGTLRQQIADEYALVNHNGSAFRNAEITRDYMDARIDELKLACVVVALRERDREEQRRIKEQIREEERAQREFERAKKDADREEAAIKKAMERMQDRVDKATSEQRVKFEVELEALRGKLIEAEEKGQRALSMAQQTKCGHVYVISNIGSFGEEVFKIGMTRRLEPTDRVRELGDASVPFPFDIHGMIYSDNAPALERDLHRRFLSCQINKVNPRKEFFRIGISDIKNAVESLGLQCSWTLAAEAAEYRESISVEATISTDALARERWIEEQLEADPVTADAPEEEALAE